MAGSKTYRVLATVLDKTKLKETDLILTLLLEDGRQVGAVAKGARKPGSRLSARCELFCSVDVLLARGRNLDIITQADLIEAPLGSAPSYEATCSASAIAEIAKHCSFEDAKDPFVSAITRKALTYVGSEELTEPHRDLIVAAYVFKLLSHVGYRPDFSGCVYCGDHALTHFSAVAGGMLCSSCAASVAGAEQVDSNMVEWFRSLISCTFDGLASSSVDASTAVVLLAHAHVWAATHLDCRLHAFEFLLGR